MPINCSIGEKHQISYSFSMFHQFDLVVSTADQIGETWWNYDGHVTGCYDSIAKSMLFDVT